MTSNRLYRSLLVSFVFLLFFGVSGCQTLSFSVEDLEPTYVVFEDDFEDGNADGWTINIPPEAPSGSFWMVEPDDGNYVLKESGQVWAEAGDYGWTNYTVEVRAKLLGSVGGGVHINFRMSGPGGRYILDFVGALSLHKEYPIGTFTDLEVVEVFLSTNRWYNIKIVCVGNSIEVYVDDVLRLSYVDEEDPFLSGRIGLEGAPDAQIYFDDVKVYTDYRLCVEYLIRDASDEIGEAKMLGANTAEAEQKLAEARDALSNGDLSTAETLAEVASKLARNSSMGHVSVGDLLGFSSDYDQHTVEVSGTIRDIRFDQGVYGFAVDDGTGVISAVFNGTLGEVKAEDKVKVTGIFDASTATVMVGGLEVVEATTEGFYSFLLFRDDFEDGELGDWRIEVDPQIDGSKWGVETEGDNHFLHSEGHCNFVAGDPEWTDYIFESRFRLEEGGTFINFRLTFKPEAPDRYTLQLSRYNLVLLKGEKYADERHFTELKRANVEIDPGTWYSLKIVCQRENIKVYLDDNLRLEYTDEGYPFLSGCVGLESTLFEGSKSSSVFFDDVKVSKGATTSDIDQLVKYASSEIEEAREINADVSLAELKLEQAKRAVDEENYQMFQYLLDEAVWLAKRSSVRDVSATDLWASPGKFSGHTVTLTGVVQGFKARYGVGYEFELHDGVSKVPVVYQGALADIGDDYEVRVMGIFSSVAGGVSASRVEKISDPQEQPEQPTPSSAGVPLSIETIATMITIGGAGIGAIGWMARTRSTSRRKKVLFKRLMDEVDDIFTRFKMNTHRCESELLRIRNDSLDEFKEGMLDEDKHDVLRTKIDGHLREIREQIEREKNDLH
jgi:hypothetical protein